MARDLSLKVNLQALDNATKPMRAVLGGAQGLGRALRDTRDELKGLQTQQRDVSSFRALKGESERTGTAMQANRDKIRQLSQALASTTTPTRALTREFQSAVRQGQALKQKHAEQQRELQGLRTRLSEAGISTRNLAGHERDLRNRISQANEQMGQQEARLKRLADQHRQLAKAKESYEKAQGLAGSMAAVGAGGLAAGSGILYTGARMMAPQLAAQEQGSMIAAQGGEGTARAGQYTGIIQGIRADGLSGDIAVIGAAVAAVNSTLGALGDISDTELKRASRKALDLAAVLGGDVAQHVQAVGILMQNGLAANSDQAFDLLTRGLQRVSTQMRGELPDILEEYSTHFRNMGFSGQEAMSLLVDMARQGRYALDKTGDAVKEFSIRGSDMSKTSKEAYESIGLDAQKMSDMIASGGAGARQALQQTAKGLLAIKSPADRANAAIALFGTPVEDLSVDQIPEFLKALTGSADHLGKVEGAASQLGDTLRDNLGGDVARLSGAWSDFNSSLMESQDGPLRDVIQDITGLVTGLKDWAAAHPQLAGGIVKTALGVGLLMAGMGGLTLALASVLGPFAMVRYGMMLFSGHGLILARTLTALGKTALPLVGKGLLFIGRALMANPIGLAITAIAGGAYLLWKHWDTLGPKFAALWEGIKATFSQTMDWFASLPARFAQLGANILQGLASGITSALGAVKGAITGAGEATIGWFKEKLGIHSPSRVFAELGGYTMAGLEQGLQAGEKGPLAQLAGTAKRLAQAGALSLGVSAGLPAMAVDNRPPLAAGGAPAAAAAPVSISITVQAAPGMDEAALARLVAQEVQRITRQQQARGRSRLTDLE